MTLETRQQLIQIALSAAIFWAVWLFFVVVGPTLVDEKAVQDWLAKKEWLGFVKADIRHLLISYWRSLTALLLTVSLFYPVLKKSAAYLARRYFLSQPLLTLSWSPADYGLPQSEFLYFFPAGVSSSCTPILKNNGTETTKINRIELKAAIFRRVSDLGTEMLTSMGISPIHFRESTERDEETGLEWNRVAEDRWVIDTPFTLPQQEEIWLPSVGLGHDEEDEQAAMDVQNLVGLAVLGIQYDITVFTDQRIITRTLSAPLRVLLRLEEGGDGGISALVNKLGAKRAAEKDTIRRAYEWARRDDLRLRKMLVQRLNQIEAEKRLQSVEQAIGLRPHDPQSHYDRGHTLLEMGRDQEALASLDKAFQLGLDNPDVHLGRGMALRGLSRLEEALGEVDRVIAARPNDAAAYVERGRILIDFGHDEDALAAFDKAIQLDQGLADGYCGRGLALVNLSADEDAVTAFNRVLELNPDACQAHLGRALVLAGRGCDDEVLIELKQALDLDYSNLDILRKFESTMEEETRGKFRQLLDSYDLLESYDLRGENSRKTAAS